ncbi:hypothetical protein HBH53_129600 [Parastagonospora nodorum]|nr:hypothetical protein HBH53_129600 [Parastagonospora nodorum]
MLLPLRKVLVVLFGLCWAVAAQQSAESKIPLCAQICLLEAFQTKACAPTNKACICTNAKFQAPVSACVAANCTIPEALATKNYSLRNCGAPIRNRGPKYVVISNVMISITAVFVIIRFAFKIVYSKLEIGLDDWAVLACVLTAIPSAIVTVFGTVRHGLGQDIWTLEPEEITKMLKYFYVMASLYFTELSLLKLTLLFFYIRVFPSKPVQRLLWGTVIFVVLWGLVFVCLAIFQCQPISYFWTHWDGLHEGHCLDINAITVSNAAISIFLDLWILGIPLWQLWGLKMHWKKKVGVALMFCVGTFVTVVSILRLSALVHFAQSSNASWEFYDVSLWSTIEISVGCMCACLPTLRLLLVKIFPVLAGSTTRSRQQYYNYGSGNELKDISANANSRNPRSRTSKSGLSSIARSQTSPPFPHDNGITVKTSYTVERMHSDTDEASLVSHENEKK